MSEAERSIRDELREIKELQMAQQHKKPKKFRMPFRGRVSNSKLRKGYITVVVIEDNKAVDFRKEPIIDGTIKLDDTFHAVEDFDIFSYKGKPLMFQPKSKLNPYNPLEGTNQTYGQKYIMARMEGDKIVGKKGIGLGLGLILGLIVAGIVLYAFLTGGSG